MTDVARELEAERAHVAAAHARLCELRDRATLVARHAGARAEVVDLEPSMLFARDVAISHAVHRAEALDVPADRLCVGRIDGDLAGEPDTSLVIGRTSVSDAAGDPLVVDWRAPVAAAFYRARPGDPMGVRRRRHFRWRGGDLVGLDDEVIDARALAADDGHLVGEGALLAALAAPRTGRMTDIVGTIQADQDRIIRRPARSLTIVQGGPGTGKTAVALHRAAYLLYELAGRGDQAAVLFLGPNRTFLRYVGDVVPSLGEDQVVLATATDIGPEVEITATDPDDVARLKGDARMAEVLARAVRGFEQPTRAVQEVACGRYVLKIAPEQVRRVVARARRRPGTHNGRAREVHRELRGLLADEFRRRVDTDVANGRPEARSIPRFAAVVDRAALDRLCDRVWPLLTPERALRRLLASDTRLRHAAGDVLDPTEAARLGRPRDHGWTAGDVALLDELADLLGTETDAADGASGARAEQLAAESFQLVETALTEEMQAALENRSADCPRCELEMTYGRDTTGTLTLTCTNPDCGGTWPAHRIIGEADAQLLDAILEEVADRYADVDAGTVRVADRTYAHVVVDEAQDVSAMQWRAVVRRCPSRSLTIVGDLDQASQPWSIHDWAEVARAAGGRSAPSDADGRPADDPTADDLVELGVNYRTPAEVMTFAADRVRALGGEVSHPTSVRSSGVEPCVRQGTLADVDTLLAEARAAIGPAGTVVAVVPDAAARPGDDGVLTATETKGLEFDGVVVFDPEAIVAESPLGHKRLYVALTRTTRLLWVVEPDR